MKNMKTQLILGLLFLTAQGLANSSFADVQTPMGKEQTGAAANSNNDRQMQSDTNGSRKSTNFSANKTSNNANNNANRVNSGAANDTTTYREENYGTDANRDAAGVAGTTNDQYVQGNMDRNMEQNSVGMSPLGIGLLVLFAIALLVIGARAYARRSHAHPVA